MAPKVVLIPSARNRVPASKIHEIDQANILESADPEAELNRQRIDQILYDQVQILPTGKAIRYDVAKRVRRAIEHLGSESPIGNPAINPESIGVTTTWTELNDHMVQLLTHLTLRRLKPSLADGCNSFGNTDPDELLMACGVADSGVEELDESYHELVQLMGYPERNSRSLAILINQGLDSERKCEERKSKPKLGRDPFKT